MRQYCSRQSMISLRLVVRKQRYSDASRTTCSAKPYPALPSLLNTPWGASSIRSSMKPSSQFLPKPRKELMRQQSPLSQNLRSRQLLCLAMQSILSKDYFKLQAQSWISIQEDLPPRMNSDQTVLDGFVWGGRGEAGRMGENWVWEGQLHYQSFFVISYKVIQSWWQMLKSSLLKGPHSKIGLEQSSSYTGSFDKISVINCNFLTWIQGQIFLNLTGRYRTSYTCRMSYWISESDQYLQVRAALGFTFWDGSSINPFSKCKQHILIDNPFSLRDLFGNQIRMGPQGKILVQ